MDDDGFPLAFLSTERTNSNKTNHFDADFKLDGSLNIQAFSTREDGTISGNDGEVALIVIDIAPTVNNGTYPVLLKNIAIADQNSVTYTTDEVETAITIDGVADTRIVLSETSASIPEGTTEAVELLVKRTIKSDTWSTLCLPFSMTEDQLTAAFGDDVQLAEFIDYDAEYDGDAVTSISVNFENVNLSNGLEANWPASCVGGVAGAIYGGTMEKCHAETSLTVTGADSYVGGLVGWSSFAIGSSYTTGSLTASGSNSYTGGLVGWSEGPVSNCYSMATTTGTQYTGGLVGYAKSSTIDKCFARGDVYGVLYGAGLVAELEGAGATATNSVAANHILNLSAQSSWGSRVIGGFKDGDS